MSNVIILPQVCSDLFWASRLSNFLIGPIRQHGYTGEKCAGNFMIGPEVV
jgi:hypothetical protein